MNRKLTNAEALYEFARKRCATGGHKDNDHDAMHEATKQVLKRDPALARAYFDDPQGSYQGAEAP